MPMYEDYHYRKAYIRNQQLFYKHIRLTSNAQPFQTNRLTFALNRLYHRLQLMSNSQITT